MLSKSLYPRLPGRTRTRLAMAAVSAVAGAVMLMLPDIAGAQSPSDPTGMTTRSEIADYLGQTFDEEPVAAGIASNGSVIEVFTSPEGGSWTIILTSPDGSSQVMAVGEAWLSLMKLKGEGI